MNPAAGGGRAARVWERLLPYIERSGIDYGFALTQTPGEATEMTRDVAEAGYERIFSVGGDGTLHETVAGLPPNAALGVIPAGRGNDFVRSLAIPLDPLKALKAQLRVEQPVAADLAYVNDVPFINVAGAGFDAVVAQKVHARRKGSAGAAAYLRATFSTLRHFEPYPLEIRWDGGELTLPCTLAAVGNARYYGGGMQICPRARTDDGQLDLCIAGELSPAAIVWNLISIFRGAHLKHPAVRYHQSPRVEIRTADGRPCPLHADGEPIGSLPAVFHVAAGRLRLLSAASSRTSHTGLAMNSDV